MAKIEKLYTSLEQDSELVQSLLDNGFNGNFPQPFTKIVGDVCIFVYNSLYVETRIDNGNINVFDWERQTCKSYRNTKDVADRVSRFLCKN